MYQPQSCGRLTTAPPYLANLLLSVGNADSQSQVPSTSPWPFGSLGGLGGRQLATCLPLPRTDCGLTFLAREGLSTFICCLHSSL